MSASRPEADIEYSRGSPASRGGQGPGPTASAGANSARVRPAAPAARAIALLGAALLVAAEFTPLLRVAPATYHAAVIRTVTAGAHHSYALIPVALLAAAMTLSARHRAGRLAPAAVAVLGLVALGIALAGDLPAAHAVGLIRHANGTYATGRSNPGIGLYLETLGAVLLVLAGGAGALLASGAAGPERGAAALPARLRRAPRLARRGREAG